MKILDEQFRNGQASYQRGVGLRAIIEQSSAFEAEDKNSEAESLVLGYIDGVIASIRRTDNLLLMPAGPDK